MAISRMNMEKQLDRKPKKMGNGGLAMISPAAALIKSIQSGQPEGLMKLSPAAQLMADKKKAATGMAKGGKVRGDGCATRGKTKGRMC